MSPVVVRSAIVTTLCAVAACGPADANNQLHYGDMRTQDPANIAQQQHDLRENDPTAAAGPAPLPPTSGKSSKAPPAPSMVPTSSAQPAIRTSAPPSRISARHVLIQWMGSDRAAPSIVRSRDQALEVAKEVLRRARNKEDFARLAIDFSDEPGAGNRGGSLGRFGHGQMVPAFEDAAFKLDVGQVSDIVETPFGFHIIQRTE